MTRSRILAALAALAPLAAPARAAPEVVANPLSADSTMLANALNGQALELTMRGTTVAVMASATPAEDGCSALISAHAPGKSRKWNRLFRWSEIAWIGTTPAGGTTVTFFEHEGRLPGDTVVFSPADGEAFRTTLSRLANNCRSGRGEADRVSIPVTGTARSCYFARLPGLTLLDSASPAPTADPPRAVLTTLAKETPQGELQLLLERGSKPNGDDWGRPSVAFTFADPRLKEMNVTAAAFALDGKPVTAQHSVTAYGDTRLRISMDPFGAATTAAGPSPFFRSLGKSGEVTLTLLDSSGQSRATLRFESGSVLTAARKALAAADWSCAGAAPPPEPAARWEPQG